MNVEALLARIRSLAQPDAAADPAVLTALGTCDPLALPQAGRLLANVAADRLLPGDRVRRLRVAITASFTVDAVPPLLRVALLRAGVDPQIHQSGFDRVLLDLTDEASGPAGFAPDVTLVLLHDGWFLPAGWDPNDLDGLRERLLDRLSMLETAVAGYAGRVGGQVLLHTVPMSANEHRSVISFAGRARLGRLWRELNSELLAMAQRHDRVHTVDLEAVLVDEPGPARDERLYRFAGAAWSRPAEYAYAAQAASFCRALAGRSKKVLVMDLDNTLWGGVLGDDGPAGIQLGELYPGNCYTELQRRALGLRRQGVLLALCSKNEAALVDQVFAEHPDLVLGMADFAAKAVDWEPKSGNVRRIAAELDLGLDSFVFADDSAFECDQVATALPEVSVVHLHGDPADHACAVLAAGHFDVLTLTGSDRERTGLYRARADRGRYAVTFDSLEDYLRGLNIRVGVRPVDGFTLPRLVQLGRRTNQFNMVGCSHPEDRTREMAASPGHLVLVFDVADRFGDEGIVGGLWVAKRADHWLIENFVMSCRVLSRGVERAVLSHVIDLAADGGAVRLEADFRATDRNRPAAGCYPAVGFRAVPSDEVGDGEIRYALPLVPRPRICPEWTELVTEKGVRADA